MVNSLDNSTNMVHATPKENIADVHDNFKPIILITNAEGIESAGLVHLVDALVHVGLYNVNVCVPQSDKSFSGHSITVQETVSAVAADITGVTAFEISGTPADCVSLALSGSLFSWSKPSLVISGINQGSSCGHHMFYSGVVAGAREALICGVPSLSISMNWRRNQSQEMNFRDAVTVCLQLINTIIRDIGNGEFPVKCSLVLQIPAVPSAMKGFKLTKPSLWRSSHRWKGVPANWHPSGHFLSNQLSLGMKLAQLSRDASAAGAARHLTTMKNVEIESVGAAEKSDADRIKKFFRLEFLDETQSVETNEDFDFTALENGFVAIVPLFLSPLLEPSIHAEVSRWFSSVVYDL